MSEPRRERCEECRVVHDVTDRGAMAVHERRGIYVGDVSTLTEYERCDGSGRMSEQERARRAADRNLAKHREAAAVRDDALVALDAFLVGRGEYSDRVAAWCQLALFEYRERWKVPGVHPYRYETKVKPASRRAETKGDIYCRFCGERLFAGVKRPHDLIADRPDAQRHLTICALQVLAGLKESVDPRHKRVPFEDIVQAVAKDDGPLFGKSKP